MYTVDTCLACGSPDLDAHAALMAPFIADYVLGRRVEPTRLLACRACGLRFFERRYEDAEVARLYRGYRGEEYFRRRNRWEFWYTRRFNEAIGTAAEQLRPRQERFTSFLARHVDVASVTDVLDYGGDRGQFLPPGLGTRRHVYDISGLPPVDGVTGWADRETLPPSGFDLIVVSHVLEHCSDPARVLQELTALARPGGTRFFIEVPLEEIDLRFAPDSGPYRGYLKLVASVSPVLVLVDFVSTAARVKWGIVPPMGFLKQHEHICYFGARALTALLERAGFRVLGCEEVKEGPSGIPPAVLCVAETARS